MRRSPPEASPAYSSSPSPSSGRRLPPRQLIIPAADDEDAPLASETDNVKVFVRTRPINQREVEMGKRAQKPRPLPALSYQASSAVKCTHLRSRQRGQHVPLSRLDTSTPFAVALHGHLSMRGLIVMWQAGTLWSR